MPEISRFWGIVIRIYLNDHGPPHFHAAYAEWEAIFDIGSLAILRGSLPRRAQSLVLEWAFLHRPELLQDWDLARSGGSPAPIPPLD